MQMIFALVAGVVFGAGLTIAQMVDPQKVLNFLDVSLIARGRWDPTLIMVFIGALPVVFAAYRIAAGWQKPLGASAFHGPSSKLGVDSRLLGGSVLFGLGWGIAGICPGPAFAALPIAGSARGDVLVFIAAMVAGLLALRAYDATQTGTDG
jgi:uncharacterized protein